MLRAYTFTAYIHAYMLTCLHAYKQNTGADLILQSLKWFGNIRARTASRRLGPSLGSTFGHMKRCIKTSGFIHRFRAHPGAVLGPSWGHLDQKRCIKTRGFIHRFRAHLGAILGPSWGHLGPCWGHLGPFQGFERRGKTKHKEEQQRTSQFSKICTALRREHHFRGSGGPC